LRLRVYPRLFSVQRSWTPGSEFASKEMAQTGRCTGSIAMHQVMHIMLCSAACDVSLSVIVHDDGFRLSQPDAG